MCNESNELLAIREQVHPLKAKEADLEKLREKLKDSFLGCGFQVFLS